MPRSSSQGTCLQVTGDQEVVSHSSQEGVRNKGGFSVLPPETLIWVYSLVGSLVRV